jgi:uncharacterized protein YbbC (DUF1343 family)
MSINSYSRPYFSVRRILAAFVLGVACYLAVQHQSVLAQSGGESTKLELAVPDDVGMRSERLAFIDDVVQEGLDQKKMPGCVIAIGRHGKIALLKAYGNKRVEPTVEPMTVDTVFDMASITKPVATATSVMALVEQGKVRIRNHVTDYVPEFGVNGKDSITIHQLLTHQGGLIPDNAIEDYDNGIDEAFNRIYNLETYVEPGSRFVYTDVGFILLADIIKRTSGLNVHEFSQKHIFEPLGMTETGYLPREELRARAAPTEQREEHWMQGEVHDPRAYRLDGIAGHAGLFSTATDLAVYAQMMLNGGTYHGKRILSEPTVERMTRAYDVSSGTRGLGWDKQTGYSSNKAELFSDRAFGHGGFTGTVLWIDPELDMFFIFLSNRVHPNGSGNVNSLAGSIATITVAAIDDNLTEHATHENHAQVQTGLDVLQASDFELLKGQRVGLITNHTGVNRDGISNVSLMSKSTNVKLTALFSPEHGIAGTLDVAKISDSEDDSTGLKIYSLYGNTRKPTAEQLSEIDTLVFDIQDIGTRFYTYVSTMGLAMQEAAAHGKRFVVLDRPNPINGLDVAGPVLNAGRESFVGFHRLPIRHGMTIGEVAKMFRSEMELELDLHVIEMHGWRRRQYFDETGLPWVNPSPNMRNLNEAILYPGIGLLETTNISVGRGTDTPFELFGAPWIDRFELARCLNDEELLGVRFAPIQFTPDSSVFANEPCNGVQISITDRSRIQPVRTGLFIAATIARLHNDAWESEKYDRLLIHHETLEAIRTQQPFARIEGIAGSGLEEFRKRRSRHLLY